MASIRFKTVDVDGAQIAPPHTIQQVTEALESLMVEDVAAGRPILSAICVSKMRPGIPARGFFLAAQELVTKRGCSRDCKAEI